MAELSTRFDDVAGESVPAEPVAIVGMAFRLPGDLGDPGALWQALTEGRDLISRIPEDRWSTTELEHPRRSEPGRAVTFSAGVLSRIDEFDAAFFGISPREAAWMDPQQRLLLELSWEAMENAGVPPSSLAGSRCAVYLGISSLDYGTRGLDDLASMTSHSMTGNTLSIAANRLSYIFDLHGPSLAVDTACSSSLVALHHACRALQTGEAPVALVGGVNLLLHPYPFVGFSKASMLSADGRCKPFDAAANGYVRAEGGVVLLLKPLKDALAAGDRIEAVILGTGVNTDGARKSGITIPSPEGQMEVMRAVLARTGVAASDVDYIEMHGTGTPVGDPIECTAVGSVFGAGRPQPLPVGSVKGNLGHLEPASGLAGLLKAVLVLQYREVPPQAHLRELNPHIDFQALNVAPVRALQPLEKAGPLRVGVNSFGFGGVNAHVLLQEHRPQPAAPVAVVRRPAACPLWLSARSPDALRELARAYAQRLAQACGETAYDLVHATALTRDRLSHRLGLWVEDGPSAAKALQAHADGREAAGVVVENVQPGLDGSGVAFVYSGNGSQWVGMGLRLLDESPRFARYLAALDARMRPVAGFSILEELRREGEASRMADTVVAQPLLFAIQVALTEVLAELEVKSC